MVEGLLDDTVVGWYEACLAPDLQWMEEVDAIPGDQISTSVNKDFGQMKIGHQSSATALFGE